jgi:hypothetical protein
MNEFPSEQNTTTAPRRRCREVRGWRSEGWLTEIGKWKRRIGTRRLRSTVQNGAARYGLITGGLFREAADGLSFSVVDIKNRKQLSNLQNLLELTAQMR